MSSTNKTQNYNLSQYVGSDKPTYLGDYNADMLAIDTQMKLNENNIEVAKTTADTAQERADEGYTLAETANGTATTANSNATEALNKSIENEANITDLQKKVVYTTKTNTDLSEITISNLDLKNDILYKIELVSKIYTGTSGEDIYINMLINQNIQKEANRFIALEVSPEFGSPQKISNPNYQYDICLAHTKTNITTMAKCDITYDDVEDTAPVLHGLSLYGGSPDSNMGQVTTFVRAQNFSNLTSIKIKPNRGVLKAGTQIIITKI